MISSMEIRFNVVMFNNISKCFTCHANLTFIQIKFVKKKVRFNSPGRLFQLQLLSKYTNLHKKHIQEHNRQLGNWSNEEFRVWTKSIYITCFQKTFYPSVPVWGYLFKIFTLTFVLNDRILYLVPSKHISTSFLITKYKTCFDIPGMILNSSLKNNI